MAIYAYQTEPLTDFSKEENIKKYQEGLRIVESYLGQTYDLIIDGKRIKTAKKMVSLNPAKHEEIVGTIYQAGVKEAEDAMQVALRAFETWKHVDPKVRADVLFKAAGII